MGHPEWWDEWGTQSCGMNGAPAEDSLIAWDKDAMHGARRGVGHSPTKEAPSARVG